MIRFAWLLGCVAWVIIAKVAVGSWQIASVLLMTGAAPSLVAWARTGRP
jgi:hypothetical protein